MKSTRIGKGAEMPLVGFGLWKVPKESCADVVYNAIKAGYRLFDGACDYGNEAECGEGVARAIKEGLVKREDLFIVSKLWNTFHETDRVQEIAAKQLTDWQIDYFDLYLIHFPIALKYVSPEVRYPPGWCYEGSSVQSSTASIQETWQAMEKLVDRGLVKEIGVCNFSGSLLTDLLCYARIRPAVLQIEHHPYLTQDRLVRFAQGEGIAVMAFSSFGAQSYLELGNSSATASPSLLVHPTVVAIAERVGRTPSQVLLRWATQRGIVVIPKSTNEGRMQMNLESSEFELEETDIKEISGLNTGQRFNDPMEFLGRFPIYA
ncbi:NAD(P)H-dependent D-xylose reductase (XR) [Aspergillus alliaceus]|uniref:D-xylose reductase [NAD(P)H] n=1 Tax=Petromyces alliaceus TaxID=209559 RepID=A0A5N7CGE9_PETAA|nr:NADP-dependent oxidoreductase domain-containing protein [Aspergillus alliaceus]KAB8235166.1 NADP-dependent oxidoreductase domain-containing protein [Aspergillus alliaceus]KAE8392838.1 NADP-dependent oxidoreductase domain-containing protein [Aspergillus alliaceus]KAF5858728.1 NAD(P)H-dependent D-xylose reductase (XR) [Aspergillus burnettii]